MISSTTKDRHFKEIFVDLLDGATMLKVPLIHATRTTTVESLIPERCPD